VHSYCRDRSRQGDHWLGGAVGLSSAAGRARKSEEASCISGHRTRQYDREYTQMKSLTAPAAALFVLLQSCNAPKPDIRADGNMHLQRFVPIASPTPLFERCGSEVRTANFGRKPTRSGFDRSGSGQPPRVCEPACQHETTVEHN